MKWIYLIIAIIGEVIATSALKESEGFTKLLPSALVLIGYSVSFYFLALTLKQIPLGIAYAIWSGIGSALISFIGLFVYQQKLDISVIIGIILILSGVLIINLFSKSTVY